MAVDASAAKSRSSFATARTATVIGETPRDSAAKQNVHALSPPFKRQWGAPGQSKGWFARQRRKARRRCLAVRGFVRLSVQESLALCSGEQRGCPFPIRHIAGVGPEIELGE